MKRLARKSGKPMLGGIPRETKPLIRLPMGKASNDIEAIAIGAFMGGAGFVVMNPSCLGSSVAPQRPELGLAVGVGIPVFFWLFSGHNYMTLAGVGTALAAYLACKAKGA